MYNMKCEQHVNGVRRAVRKNERPQGVPEWEEQHPKKNVRLFLSPHSPRWSKSETEVLYRFPPPLLCLIDEFVNDEHSGSSVLRLVSSRSLRPASIGRRLLLELPSGFQGR